MTITTRLKVKVLNGPWRDRDVLVRNPPPTRIELPVRHKDGSIGQLAYRIDKGPHGYFAELYVEQDATLPTIGWRGWRLIETGGEEPNAPAKVTFLGSSNGTLWTPREPLVASCGPEKGEGEEAEPKHDAPAEGCWCGIYATRTLSWLRTHGYTLEVFGLVTLWGRSRQHDQGFRYERAYPFALILNDARLPDQQRSNGGHIFGAELGSDHVDATVAAALARLAFLHEQYGVPVALGAPERGIQIIGRMAEQGLLPKWSEAVLPTDIRAQRRA